MLKSLDSFLFVLEADFPAGFVGCSNLFINNDTYEAD